MEVCPALYMVRDQQVRGVAMKKSLAITNNTVELQGFLGVIMNISSQEML
jgi:hypothetical protein